MVHEARLSCMLAMRSWCAEHGIFCCKAVFLCPWHLLPPCSVCQEPIRFRQWWWFGIHPSSRGGEDPFPPCLHLDPHAVHGEAVLASTRVLAGRKSMPAAATGSFRPRHGPEDRANRPPCTCGQAQRRTSTGQRRGLALRQALRNASTRPGRPAVRDSRPSEALRT